MPLRPRVIACLDVKDGRVVKGTRFENLRDSGDPVELACRYEEQGADEIVFLDVSASLEARGTLLDTVRRTAEALFVPLTVGGGVRSAGDIGTLLRAGADKVSVNSAALMDPALLEEAARLYGRQCVVVSVDAARAPDGGWSVFSHGGTRAAGRDAVEWALEATQRGAGEVLLTSIDRDGTKDGYDLELTGAVTARVDVPVIASGGAGNAAHLRAALGEGGASAVLVAGILHEGVTTVSELKVELRAAGVPVR